MFAHLYKQGLEGCIAKSAGFVRNRETVLPSAADDKSDNGGSGKTSLPPAAHR